MIWYWTWQSSFPRNDWGINLQYHEEVGSDSWAFFKTLHVDPGFLQLSPHQWPLDKWYQEAKATTENLRVVNDSAEQGVKLGSDFLSAAKIEKRYQNALQVAENDKCQISENDMLNLIAAPGFCVFRLDVIIKELIYETSLF